MKRKILLVAVLFAFLAFPVKAAVTVEETTDAEYMINSGFSQIMAEDVFMLKNRVAGKPVEPLYETSNNVFVKGWKKFFSYLDPAQESYDRLHHDIKMAPSFSDL